MPLGLHNADQILYLHEVLILQLATETASLVLTAFLQGSLLLAP